MADINSEVAMEVWNWSVCERQVWECFLRVRSAFDDAQAKVVCDTSVAVSSLQPYYLLL